MIGEDRLTWTWWTARALAARLWPLGAALAGAGLVWAVYASAAEPRKVRVEPPKIIPPLVLDPAKPLSMLTLPELAQTLLGPIKPTDFKSAKPFFFSGASDDRGMATDCLAAAAWYEAGTDAVSQRSVIQVVLNRVRHPSFPKSVCGVVFQGSERRTGCQFTFTCDGSLQRRTPSPESWRLARVRASAALDGSVDHSVLQATHYHANYVVPWWSSKLERLAVVGAHIFYRWPGSRGQFQNTPQWQPEFKPGRPLDPDADAALISATGGIDPAKTGNAAGSPARIVPDPRIFDNLAPSAPLNPAIMLAIDPAEVNGRWALAAMNACAGKADCQVLAYGDPSLLAKNRTASTGKRDRPLFLFIRDQQSRMTITMWDCERAERSNAGQCMPASNGAMQHLLNDRYNGR